MIQTVELNDEEQVQLYLDNCSKEELAKMLTEANKHLNKPLSICGVGSTLCYCDSLEAKQKTDISKPYECAKCNKPIYKN